MQWMSLSHFALWLFTCVLAVGFLPNAFGLQYLSLPFKRDCLIFAFISRPANWFGYLPLIPSIFFLWCFLRIGQHKAPKCALLHANISIIAFIAYSLVWQAAFIEPVYRLSH